MKPGNLSRGEVIAIVGGALMAVSIFLVNTYEARPENENAMINGLRGPVTFWQAHPILRYLILAAAAAPFILAWIVIRDHELSWPRGEVTAIVALIAFGLLSYTGIIDRPGEPASEIELEIGWYGLMLGSLLMFGGSVMRMAEHETRRKPPGVM